MRFWWQRVPRPTGATRAFEGAKVGRLSLALSLLVGTAAAAAAPEAAASFAAEMDAAMHRMMKDMAVEPSGDADRDFVAMMVPHHQGAIDMAVVELRFGKNERLKRIAREIVIEQQQEIAAMRLALAQPTSGSAPAPATPERDTPAPPMPPHGER